MRHPRSIRDSLYGYVEVPGEFDGVLDHPLYQRLRRVGQMSLTSHVFPGATGSRFEHSLGAMHLARRACRAAWRNAEPEAQHAFAEAFCNAVTFDQREYDTGDAAELIVAGVALLHDLGHPPFSHILEPYFAARYPLKGDRAFHERVGLELTPAVLESAPAWLRRPIQEVLVADEHAGTWDGALHAIVAGEIDIDRLDYLMRDAERTGTEFGGIDYAKLLDSYVLYLREDGLAVAPHARARRAVESLLVQRVQAYRWVAHHHRAIASSIALARSLEELDALAADNATSVLGTRTLAEVFAPLAPAMNLLDPAANLSHLLPHLPEHLVADDRTLMQVQASIDDATVVEALKKAIVASQLLEAAGEATEAVTRFRIYAETALNRARGAVTAWKTTDAYRATSDQIAPDLRRLIEAEVPELTEELLAQIGVSSVRFVKWLIDELLTDDRVAEFDARLAERVPHAEAVEVHRLHFTAMRESATGARLYEPTQPGKEIRVVETSELARALGRVAAESPPLRLYAFAEPERVRTHGAAMAEALRDRFANEFVHLAGEALPSYVNLHGTQAVIESLARR